MGGLGTQEIIILLIPLLIITVIVIPIACLIIWFMKKNKHAGMKRCQYCAEMIQAAARVCRFCGREVND